MTPPASTPPTESCPSCGTRVRLTRDGRGRRVIPFHRTDGASCPATGTVARTQDPPR